MGIRRVRRLAFAVGVLVFVWMGQVGHCQTAEGEAVPSTLHPRRSHFEPGAAAGNESSSLDPPTTESPLSVRPSPFYEADHPVVAPPATHAQRVPARAMKPPAKPDSKSQPAEIHTPRETARLEKTPLPDADFAEGSEPAPATRGRSGFGSSVAWALGILAVGWLARQFLKSGGPLSNVAPSAIELLSRQSIGPQQQLALVRLGRRILLVGTTPTGMSTLATVDDPVEVQTILSELRASTSQVGPTLLDLFRNNRSEPTRDSAPVSVSLSTNSRATHSDRRPSPPLNREVADV